MFARPFQVRPRERENAITAGIVLAVIPGMDAEKTMRKEN
jgi:hypothetical protein